MAEEDEIGGGVGTLNDGNSGLNTNVAETGGGGSGGGISTSSNDTNTKVTLSFLELFQKWGTTFENTTTKNGYSYDQLEEIKRLSRDLSDAINYTLSTNLRVLENGDFKSSESAILKSEEIELFNLYEPLKSNLVNWYDGWSNRIDILDPIRNEQIWNRFIELERELMFTNPLLKVPVSVLTLKSNYQNALGYHLNRYYYTSRGTRYYVTKINLRSIYVDLIDVLQNYVILNTSGTIKSIGETITEKLYHSTVGNYKDLPPGNERVEAIKTLEKNLKESVDKKELYQYTIDTFGTFTKLRITVFDNQPFNEELKVKVI